MHKWNNTMHDTASTHTAENMIIQMHGRLQSFALNTTRAYL